MSNRSVLIFAYHFPPENAIGGLRPYRFSRYLPEHGLTCHVITAADVSTRPDLQAESIADPFMSGDRGRAWQKERAVRKLLLPGVTGVSWSSLAARAGERFLRNNKDVVLFSTYPPLGTHLAARRLVRQYRLPWIADFRDPLAGNPAHAKLGAHSKWIYSHLERSVVNEANVVIANTDEAQRILHRKYPAHAAKVVLLWNGFDPHGRIVPLPLAAGRRRTLSHVGELYEGRTAAPLIEAFARLIRSGRLSPEAFGLRLIGPASPSCLPEPALQAKAESQGWLTVVPQQIPKPEAEHIAQTSDGLLILQPHSAVQVPGKLFEYLQIGRPILAYVPRDSSIERVLAKSGVPFVCIYTGSDLQTGILDYLSLPPDAVKPSAWFEETFNVQKQSATLARLIENASSQH